MDGSNPLKKYLIVLGILAIVALPLVGFWFGIEYARSVGSLVVTPNGISPTPSSTPPTSSNTLPWTTPGALSSTTNNVPQPNEIQARTIITIPTDQSFTLTNYPLVKFKINAVSKAYGGITIDRCGKGDQSIFIKHTHIFSTPGTCISTTHGPASSTAAVIVVDLTIENQSNNFLSSRFVQLFYNEPGDEGNATLLADSNPNWESYGGRPYADQRILLGFVVPDYQNDFQLIYGDYGRLGISKTNEDFFGRSIGGFLIDFAKKTISNIPG